MELPMGANVQVTFVPRLNSGNEPGASPLSVSVKIPPARQTVPFGIVTVPTGTGHEAPS